MSFIGSRRSHPELSFIYAGDNSGHGSVVIVPALPNPACGCDYRCVVLDEFSANVKCICPEGWKLKKDNQTACERKNVLRMWVSVMFERRTFLFAAMFRNEIPMEYLIIFFAVITLLLIAALGALIFILCKCWLLSVFRKFIKSIDRVLFRQSISTKEAARIEAQSILGTRFAVEPVAE